ncbi:substrate-binding domain-containing protein [Streptomyces sp. NPDC020802]|uniref:substrate-binding domain-containing protein n=1 Tax=Streptomyces sp. NPDC020802 TaxID=3365094 RepID=UPI0037A88440
MRLTDAGATHCHEPPRPRRTCPYRPQWADRGRRRRCRPYPRGGPPAAHPPPTSVLAFSDRCASSVLDIFLRAGITVPDDISVVGFDDSHLACLAHINITTAGQDIHRLAQLAVDRAVARVGGAMARSTPGNTSSLQPRGSRKDRPAPLNPCQVRRVICTLRPPPAMGGLRPT